MTPATPFMHHWGLLARPTYMVLPAGFLHLPHTTLTTAGRKVCGHTAPVPFFSANLHSNWLRVARRESAIQKSSAGRRLLPGRDYAVNPQS